MSHGTQSFALAAGVALVAARLLGVVSFSLAPVLLLFAAIPIQIGLGMLLWRTVQKDLLPEIGGWDKAFKHALLIPAAIALLFCNSVHSLCTRQIYWRGVRYRLISRDSTEVLSGKSAV